MQVNGVCTGAKRAAMGCAIVSSSSIDLSRSMGKFLQVVVWVQGVSHVSQSFSMSMISEPRRAGNQRVDV